jgi:hypothetical protein
MKRTINHNRATIILTLFFFAVISSCEKVEPDSPPANVLSEDSLITLKQLRDLYEGDTISFKESGLNILATVTMDDSSGNIFREAFVQDDEAGIFVRLSQFGNFKEGDSVRIALRGGALYDYRGMMQLADIDGSTNIIVQAPGKHTEPIHTTIDQITSDMQGLLVKLDDVQFSIADAGVPYALSPEEQSGTNRRLEDCDGNTLIVRTSGYANFAQELTPEGNGSIIGLVGEHLGDMQLHIRRTSEVNMEGERCEPPGEDLDLITIAQIKQMHSEGATNLPPNSRIEGVIISDRDHENLPGQNAYLMDEHGDGIALRFQSWHSLDMSLEVRIVSSNLPITRFNGLLQVDEIPLGNAVVLAQTDMPEPVVTTIQDLKNNINDYESTLVLIEDAMLPGGGTFAGNVVVTDNTGSIDMYTTNWASFANSPITGGRYNITAIASIYNSPQLQIRNLDDLELLEEDDHQPGDPVTSIDEDFQSYPDHAVINNDGWTAFAEDGNRNWICRTFQNNHYAQATAYNSADPTNVMWMITPPIDRDAMSNPVFEFESAKAFYTHDGFSLHISSDFDGTNVTAATWVPLEARLAGQSDPDNEWIHSGYIDLSPYQGIIHIAWKYESAAPQGNTGTFRVDNVKLYED